MSVALSAALDSLTESIKAHLVTSHAGRLIRWELTHGESPESAANRALGYVVKVCGPIDADLVADIAKNLLAQAEEELKDWKARMS